MNSPMTRFMTSEGGQSCNRPEVTELHSTVDRKPGVAFILAVGERGGRSEGRRAQILNGRTRDFMHKRPGRDLPDWTEQETIE